MDSLPTIQKGCLVLTVKGGTIVVAIFYLFYGLLMAGSFQMKYDWEHRRSYATIDGQIVEPTYYHNRYLAQNFVHGSHDIISFVLFVISILLLVAIFMNKPDMVKVWLYCAAVCAILQLVCVLIGTVLGILYTNLPFWYMIYLLLFTVLLLYCIVVVNSFYKSGSP